MKPSITICPDNVPVIVEFCPDAKSATANNVLRSGEAIVPTILLSCKALYKSVKRPRLSPCPWNNEAPRTNSKQFITNAIDSWILESIVENLIASLYY